MRKRLLLIAVLALAAFLVLPGVAVARTKTKLSISQNGSYERADFTPTLTAQLKTSRGKAIKKTRVYLYRDDQLFASAKTNSKGRVTFAAPIPDELDRSKWQVRFRGDRKYKPSTSATKYTNVEIIYDGWAPALPRTQDANGEPVYHFTAHLGSMVAGRTYYLWFESPTVVTIKHPLYDMVIDSSRGLPVNDFWFTAPDSTGYALSLDSTPAWGCDGSLWVFAW